MKIEKKPHERYVAILTEHHRPPSRGGNTRAWYQHRLTIGGEVYSFLALGAKKWVFARDLVNFEWDWDETRRYRNVKPDSVETWDKNGNQVVRGLRGSKKWRTAPTRPPGSVREQRD